jgi:D-threo-aldose 1-dehydrogenase
VDIVFIHSPDNHYPEAITEAYPQLAELRAQGVVKAIGVGITQWQMALRFAQEGDFDCFLLASRYTLLEQTALPVFLPYCEKHNISVIIGGPYNSGILASKLQPSAKYDYHDAPPKILAKARRIKAICDRFNVPLKAAALQFVLAHPTVASVIPGSSYPGHMEENFQMVQHPICRELWDTLRNEGLISPQAPTP